MSVQEHFFTCPYCFSNISMVLEAMTEKQEYIEDCEVCCRPINIEFSVLVDESLSFLAKSIDE